MGDICFHRDKNATRVERDISVTYESTVLRKLNRGNKFKTETPPSSLESFASESFLSDKPQIATVISSSIQVPYAVTWNLFV